MITCLVVTYLVVICPVSVVIQHLSLWLQDDAAGDPQWSMEQILASEFRFGETVIGREEYELMARTTVTVFEVLERAWASLDCALIDMKIEFGVDNSSGKQLSM